MNKEQLDALVEEHFAEFCSKIARESGVSPLASLLIVEWPDTNGSLSFQAQAALPKPVMMKILDELRRKVGIVTDRLKRQINTQGVPGQKQPDIKH